MSNTPKSTPAQHKPGTPGSAANMAATSHSRSEVQNSDQTSAAEAAKQKLGDASETVRDSAASAASAVSEAAAAAKRSAANAASSVAESVEHGYEQARTHTDSAYRSSRRMAGQTARTVKRRSVQTGKQVETYFEDNPLMIGAVGFFGGLLLGSMLPRTQSEDRHLGRWRDEAARTGLAYGREYADRASSAAEEFMTETRRNLEPETDQARYDRQSNPGYSPNLRD